MRTIDRVKEKLSEFDLDGASGFYEAELEKAARAAVDALKNPTDIMPMLRVMDAYSAGLIPLNKDLTEMWNATLDAILNEKD